MNAWSLKAIYYKAVALARLDGTPLEASGRICKARWCPARSLRPARGTGSQPRAAKVEGRSTKQREVFPPSGHSYSVSVIAGQLGGAGSASGHVITLMISNQQVSCWLAVVTVPQSGASHLAGVQKASCDRSRIRIALSTTVVVLGRASSSWVLFEVRQVYIEVRDRLRIKVHHGRLACQR